jgi:hypothetical protein
VRRAVFQQAIVVGRGVLAPAPVGIVPGLRGEDRLAIVVEFDLAIVVRDRFVWFHAGKTNASGEPAQIDNVDS